MSTRAVLAPYSAEFPISPFPFLGVTGSIRPILGYDDTATETAVWTLVVPADGFTTPVSLVVSYIMASATSGTVIWVGKVEAVTANDALNLGSGSSFDLANSVSVTAPSSAGVLGQATIPLTLLDGAAAADYLRISVGRDGASDSATGDAQLLCAELRDSA